MKIFIRYLPGAEPLTIRRQGNWIDLYTYEDTDLKAGEYRNISLGFAMQLPEGFEAYIVPRSSTFKRYGIMQANSIGIIDNAYCGNEDIWAFPAYATRDVSIPKGTRICQFRIMPAMMTSFPDIQIETAEELSGSNRGGFGSTGK